MRALSPIAVQAFWAELEKVAEDAASLAKSFAAGVDPFGSYLTDYGQRAERAKLTKGQQNKRSIAATVGGVVGGGAVVPAMIGGISGMPAGFSAARGGVKAKLLGAAAGAFEGAISPFKALGQAGIASRAVKRVAAGGSGSLGHHERKALEETIGKVSLDELSKATNEAGEGFVSRVAGHKQRYLKDLSLEEVELLGKNVRGLTQGKLPQHLQDALEEVREVRKGNLPKTLAKKLDPGLRSAVNTGAFQLGLGGAVGGTSAGVQYHKGRVSEREFQKRGEAEKLAATRALKNIQRAFRKSPDEADILARRYSLKGALKRTNVGSQIKALGGGVEGPASVTVGQDTAGGGVAVRKMLDPTGYLHSPEITRRKLEVGKALRGDKRFARLLSDEVGSSGGAPFMHYEYVQGEPGTKGFEAAMSARAANRRSGWRVSTDKGFFGNLMSRLAKEKRKIDRSSKILPYEKDVAELEETARTAHPDYVLEDVARNPGNWIKTKQGKKIIDYLPFTKAESDAMQAQAVFGAMRKGGLPLMGPSLNDVWAAGGVIKPQGSPREANIKGTLRRMGWGSRETKKVRGATPSKPLRTEPTPSEPSPEKSRLSALMDWFRKR